MMTTMKQWFKDKNVLFCTNGDIVPDSPLLDSIATYKDVVDNNLLCIPGKNIANNNPIFGLQAFQLMIIEALKRGYDYIIYIDADCFIWSLENLKSKFEEFITQQYIIGGVPDGGIFCHRNTNNFCINPFLTFFSIKRIKQHFINGKLQLASPTSELEIPEEDRRTNALVLEQCKNWRARYQPTVPYMKTANFMKTNSVETAYTTSFTLMSEWYYKLFLGFHYPDERFMWIYGRDYVCDADPFGLTSGLYLNEHMEDDSNLICLHTWFSRCLINPECKDRILVPHDDIDQGLNHAKRIKDVIQLVKSHLTKDLLVRFLTPIALD